MIESNIRIVTATLAALCLMCVQAVAHPHVWVVMKSELVFAPDGSATGVHHAWTFDDMFSTFATQGLETKEKGKFTREELQPLAEVNVSSLKEFDFFTYGNANGQKAEFADPKDYWLEFNDGDKTLTLHFTMPLKTPVKAKTFDVEVYDPTYYVDFALADKDPVALAGAPAACKFTIGKPQEMTKEMADKLAQIGPNQQIPANSYGAQFANKISVKCP
ncbi:MAG: DUF1007 family protein [Rhizobiales bacterium]|nr:DUF1007 family protein [Hyphomicrobiales bacterium]